MLSDEIASVHMSTDESDVFAEMSTALAALGYSLS